MLQMNLILSEGFFDGKMFLCQHIDVFFLRVSIRHWRGNRGSSEPWDDWLIPWYGAMTSLSQAPAVAKVTVPPPL